MNDHCSKWQKAPTNNDPTKVPVIGFGSGRFGRRQYGGKPAGLAEKCRKLLKKAEQEGKLIVMDINEYNTSQVCSRCGEKALEQIRAAGLSLYTVLACTSCRTVWQRDINASRNIYGICYNTIYHGHRPSIFLPSGGS